MTPTPPNPGEVSRGSAIYTAPLLHLYDFTVLRFNNRRVWHCSRERILDHYHDNLRCHHLDVGPGTGWYLSHARYPCTNPRITLLDMSPSSLAVAATRLKRFDLKLVEADVFSPFAFPEKFESIAANYVLHCLPGDWSAKGLAIGNIASALAPDGVFFGSTILGRGVPLRALGRVTTSVYNRIGIFNNESDDIQGLRTALDTHFHTVSTKIVGSVALFRATQPRQRTA